MDKKKLLLATLLASTLVGGTGIASADDGYDLNNSTIALEADKVITNTIDLGSNRKTTIRNQGTSSISSGNYTLTANASGATGRNVIVENSTANSNFTFTGNLIANAISTGNADARAIRMGATNSNNLFNGSIEIDTSASGKDSLGIQAWNGSETTFSGELIDVSSVGTGSAGYTRAIQVYDAAGAKVTLSSNEINLSAEGGYAAEGIYAHRGKVYVNGDANITAQNGSNNTRGIDVPSDGGSTDATYNAGVYLNGDNINITSLSENDNVLGILSSGTYSTVESNSNNLNITAKSDSGVAQGLVSQYGGKINLTEGTNTTVNVEAATGAYGVSSQYAYNYPGHFTSHSNLTVNATGVDSAYGVLVYKDSSFVADQLNATGTATGEYGAGYGVNIVDSKDVTIGSSGKNSSLIGAAGEYGEAIGLNILDSDGESASATLRGTMAVEGSTYGIYNEGSLTNEADLTVTGTMLTRGTFTNNANLTISNEIDSAIWNEGTITSGDNAQYILTNNSAEFGGAFYNSDGATATINGGTFEGNTATAQGGAIYNKGDLTIQDSSFENNSTKNGGAIVNEGSLSIDNSQFIGNTITGSTYGGVIWNKGTQDSSISNSIFSGNYTAKNNSSPGGYGGVIYNASTGKLTLDNNTFSGNGKIVDEEGNVTVKTSQGGVIYNNSGSLDVISSVITGNTANKGGAIYQNGGTVSINGGSVAENIAKSGGAIYAYNAASVTNIDGTTFKDNISTDGQGGAIRVEKGSFEIKNATIDGNIGLNENAANYIVEKIEHSENWHTIPAETVTAGSGGAIYNSASGKTSSITGGTISNNISKDGGGIYNTKGTIEIDGTTFEGNSALNNGGAVANINISTTKTTAVTSIKNTTFANNVATGLGGAIYNGSQTLILDGSNKFSGNKSNVTYDESGNILSSVDNDIYNNGGIINIISEAGETNTFKGGIAGNNQAAKLNINGAGTVDMQGNLTNHTVKVNAGELHLTTTATNGSNLAGSAVTVNSGAVINTIDNVINDYSSAITLADGAYIKLDTSLATPSADTYTITSGDSVTINEIKVLTDTENASETVSIATAGNVSIDGNVKAYTTNSKYNVTGNIADDGTITLTKDGQGGLRPAANETGEAPTTRDNVTYTLTGVDTTTNGGEAIITNADMTIQGAGDSDDKKVTLYDDLVVGASDTDNSTLTINEAKFEQGSTSAVIANNAGATLTIKDSLIGAAIDNKGSSIIIDSTVGLITNSGTMVADPVIHTDRLVNTGTYAGAGDVFNNLGSSSVNGGAINNSGILTLTKEDDTNVPTFTGNTAAYGGAIFNSKVKVGDDIVVNVSDAVFTKNNATANGGAIYNSGAMSITGTTFGDGTDANKNTAKNGGAIYNASTGTVNIADTTFNANGAVQVGGSGGYGGAIENEGTLNIDGSTFKGNTAATVAGAIDNYAGTVTITNSTFGGSATGEGNSASHGGAIQSEGGTLSISNNSSFLSNTAIGQGGAIRGVNTTITLNDVDFSGNTVTGTSGYGGAIYANSGTTLGISNGSTFTANSATQYGGAIYSVGNTTIEDSIFGATSQGNSAASGGAVYYAGGTATINNSQFVANSATSFGGAIASGTGVNGLTIDGSTFTSNTANSGGAVATFGNANILGSTFTSNSATSTETSAGGGAVFVGGESNLNVINSKFASNNSAGNGGAIATRTKAQSGGDTPKSSLYITGDGTADTEFNGNTAGTNGGAIWTEVKTVVANTNFTNNTATSGNGGAISHTATDSNRFLEIIADETNVTFSGNTANGSANDIYNTGRLDLIATGDTDTITFNGGITGDGDININKLGTDNNVYKVLNGTDIEDKTISTAAGNVVFNADVNANNLNVADGTLTNAAELTVNDTFTNDGTVENGTTLGTLNVKDGVNNGSITQGTVNIAEGNTGFDNNDTMTVKTSLKNTGIFNNNADVIVENTTNNANLNNTGTLNSTADSVITADTLTNTGIMNLTKSQVAVIYQADDIEGTINVLGSDPANDVTDFSITGDKPNFAGNLNVGNEANKATLNLNAGNVVEDAIVNVASGSVLNVDDSSSTGTASVVLNSDDTFAGDVKLASGDVTMKDVNYTTGDTSTTVGGSQPYYEQTGGNLNLENASLTMADASKISGGDMHVDSTSHYTSQSGTFNVGTLQNSGTVHSINGGYENHAFDNLVVGHLTNGDKQGDFTIDLYARSNGNKQYDQFGKDSTVISAADPSKQGTAHIADFTLNGDLFGYDAPIDKSIKLDNLFKGSVQAGHDITFSATDKEIYTPIGWYKLNSTGGGNYSFDISRYSDQAFRGQVSKIAQYQNQLAIDDMIFNHTMLDQGFKGNDYITSNPNRYASANDMYAPYQYSRKEGGLWVKTYANFERLNMNHGLDVGNNAYGTIIGADFGLKQLRNGWQFMPTAYVGYNGAHQYWSGTGAYQNGAQAGFLGTWYKKDFMIGALAYGGFYGNEMSTPRGNDSTFNYFAGGATKAAYNWRFHKDWSLQPNLLLAYNFFGQENWHTDFGQMGMMAGMLHGINIAPGLNLIWEKETFSIYATIQYMYNINQSVGGRAGNDVYLPRVSMDRGYLQYGLGINKKFSDRFSGYFQTVIRNVGRNGVGLQLGFNWLFGKGGSSKESSKSTIKNSKKVIKSNVTSEVTTPKKVVIKSL